MTSTPSLDPIVPGNAINMPTGPVIGDYYVAENGVRYSWDGVKWILTDDSSLTLWTYDTTDQTLTPSLAGVGIKANDDTGSRSAAMQSTGYDINVLPELK